MRRGCGQLSAEVEAGTPEEVPGPSGEGQPRETGLEEAPVPWAAAAAAWSQFADRKDPNPGAEAETNPEAGPGKG